MRLRLAWSNLSLSHKLTISINLTLLLSLLIACAITVLVIGNTIEKRMRDNEIPNQLIAMRYAIEKELAIPVNTARQIAHSTFLRDWAKRGEPSNELKAWLEFAQEIRSSEKIESVFWVSNKTLRYYAFDGILKTIQRNQAKDQWFFDFLAKNNNIRLDFDFDEKTLNHLIFINYRIPNEYGIAGVGLNINKLANTISQYKIGVRGQFYLVDANGKIIIHRDVKKIGKSELQKMEGISSIASRLLDKSHPLNQLLSYKHAHEEWLTTSAYLPDSNVYLIAEIPANEIRGHFGDAVDSLLLPLLGQLVLCLALMGSVTWLLGKTVTRPLLRLNNALQAVVAGKTFTPVRVRHHDELGRLTATCNELMLAQQSALHDTTRVMSALVAGDLSQRIEGQLCGELGQMQAHINHSLVQLTLTFDEFNQLMAKIAAGDFSRLETRGLVEGSFAHVMHAACAAGEQLASIIGEIGTVMLAVARGDLRTRVEGKAHGDLADLKQHINQSLDSLRQTLTHLAEYSQHIALATRETYDAIQHISAGTRLQQQTVDGIALAVNQTAITIANVENHTRSARDNASKTLALVQNSRPNVERMVQMVQAVARNSSKIEQITSLIERLADRTHLLALNAGIEAARAGVAGRGFAVVAEEVGKLATNSADASRAIAQLLGNASQEVSEALQAVQAVHHDMDEIEHSATDTDSVMLNVNHAITEQHAALRIIDQQLGDLGQIAINHASAGEEIATTMGALANIATHMRHEVEQFRL